MRFFVRPTLAPRARRKARPAGIGVKRCRHRKKIIQRYYNEDIYG